MRNWLLRAAEDWDTALHAKGWSPKWLCDLAELSYGCPYGDPRTDAINWPQGCSWSARVLYRWLSSSKPT